MEQPLHDTAGLSSGLRFSMIAVSVAACLSCVSCTSMLIYLTILHNKVDQIRLAIGSRHQIVLLLFNLLLGDLLQSFGFGLNCVWLAQNRFFVDSACIVQGTFIQIGDIASSSFVVSIAIHTFARVYLARSIASGLFLSWMIFIWLFSIFTGIGVPYIVISHSKALGDYYGLAGAWCWIRPDRVTERFLSVSMINMTSKST